MQRFIFVGLRPSISAWKFGKQWSDGAYAGKQLKDALDKLNLDFTQMCFCNLFNLPLEKAKHHSDAIDLRETIKNLRVFKPYWTIVGMGQEVQETLDRYGIDHLKLIHPAARGKIRKKSRYLKHCRQVLFERRTNGQADN